MIWSFFGTFFFRCLFTQTNDVKRFKVTDIVRAIMPKNLWFIWPFLIYDRKWWIKNSGNFKWMAKSSRANFLLLQIQCKSVQNLPWERLARSASDFLPFCKSSKASSSIKHGKLDHMHRASQSVNEDGVIVV